MRKILLIAVSLLLLLGLVFFSQIRLGVLSTLFLWDLLDEEGVQSPHSGALAWITRTPSVNGMSIPVGERAIAADLYHYQDGKKRAAILLTHGIIETGKDDPRLIRFAHSLARSGFVVLVPDLLGMKSLRVRLSDVDDIVASFRFLSSLKNQVDKRKMGLLGFSYGAGPTFMAAAHPLIRNQVKFITSFGGYYDPINVVRFVTTGYYEYRGEKGFLRPEPYGKWVFFVNNLDYVERESDQEILREIFKKEESGQTGERREIQTLLKGLSPEGQALYELLVNKDPNRVEGLFEKTDRKFQDYLQRISLSQVIPSVDAYMLIGHGTTDPLIPYTESLRLADAVRDGSRVHVTILKLFSHVDPTRKSYSAREFLTIYLPSLAQFYYLFYDILSQQL
jgi:pimeloyl-ACP methyl ester carboxylesterase